MNGFPEQVKGSSGYVDLAANLNGEEKAASVVEACNLVGAGTIRLLEIGPGGGASILSLAESIKKGRIPDKLIDLVLVELDCIKSDSLPKAMDVFRNVGTCRLIHGNALDLEDLIGTQSVEVINASSVLHEIFSYAGGYSGINSAVRGISRTLKKDGFFVYRDILALEDEGDIHDRKTHSYSTSSWIRFIKIFLPYYLVNAQHPYHHYEDAVIVKQGSECITYESIDCSKDMMIEAPVGLLREIQRHYLTFRDHMWRSGALGFVPKLSGDLANEWTEYRHGHKRVNFKLSKKGPLSEQQTMMLKAMAEKKGNYYNIDGDIFDEVTDEAISDYLAGMSSSDLSDSDWKQWQTREARESYVYMSISQFLGCVALQSLEASNPEEPTILIPNDQNSIRVYPRMYYNRFLKNRLPNPLFDAKQHVIFKKVGLDDVTSLNLGLQAIKQFCDRKTLARIYAGVNRRV